MMVDERRPETRIEILDYIERKGYQIEEDESRTREEIVNGLLPLVIDTNTKTYRMMGNVTCAAAAVSSGHLIKKEMFYKIISEIEG